MSLKLEQCMYSGLPNDCGLISAAAWVWLQSRKVPSRILHIDYGPNDGHTIVIFQSVGRLCTYDAEGSMVFTPDANWKMEPILLAKAWCKAVRNKKKPVKAEWH